METIRLAVLETGLTEKQIFMMLITHSLRADIPHHFSVDSHNWDEGWIILKQLYNTPAHTLLVGIADNQLIVNAEDAPEVSRWLNEWKIKFDLFLGPEAKDPEAAQELIKEIRSCSSCANDRAKIGKELEAEIAALKKDGL